MHRTRTEEVIGLDKRQQWERDRQIILAQLHNLMLALRSNTKFSSRMRFVQAAMEPQHRLMTAVKNLREALFSPQMEELPEADILTPFCEVALSEETTEPITGVALAAFVTFLDLKCSFLTTQSLVRLSDTASNSKSEIADAQSHEAVLARILQVYVGCARHPAAVALAEQHIVGMLERAYAVSTHGDPSELLRRTAEQAMNDIVTAVFYRIVEECHTGDAHQIHHGSTNSDLAINGETAANDSKQVCSGALVIQYICRLIMCNVALPQVPPGHSAVSVAAVQLQGLCLAHTSLFILKDSLRLPQCLPLLRFVRNDLCRALLTIGTRTENIIVLSQLLRTAHLVVQFASVAVVPQALSIIKGIHLTPMMNTITHGGNGGGAYVESPLSASKLQGSAASGTSRQTPTFGTAALDDLETREMHEMLIESLLEFCSDHSFATFCFVHYDLSTHYPPLLEQLAVFLSRQCFLATASSSSSALVATGTGAGSTASTPTTGPTPLTPALPNGGGSSGVASQRQQLLHGAHLNQINILAFDSLMGMLLALVERFHADDASASSSDDKAQHNASLIREAIHAKLAYKRHIMTFAEKFAQDALKEGVKYFLDTHPNPASVTGWEVGEFLFEHRAVLDKNLLGEYLGDLGKEPVKPDSADIEAVARWEADRVDDHRKPGAVRFFERQLRGFLHGFQFHNKELLQSIREMVFQMRLPGEAQKIDRVMQAFAEHWFACNQHSDKKINPFRSEDAAFILSFSIIMLNTDLHSGKLDKTMTKDQFRSMNRGIDNGENVPEEYLNNTYDAVKGEQIIMIDMVRQAHEFDAVWRIEMAEARQQAHDSLLAVSMRGNTAPDLRPFDPFVFHVLWKPILMGLASVFEASSQSFQVDRTMQTVEQLRYILKKRAGKDFGIFQCALEGIRYVVELGDAFGVSDAVDHVVLTLLRHAPLSLQNGYSNLQMLGRSPSTLLSVATVFDVMFHHHDTITAAWDDVASFLHLCYLLGLFSDHWGMPGLVQANASVTSDGGAAVEAASPTLLDDSMASPLDETTVGASSPSRTYSEVIRDADGHPLDHPEDTLSAVLRCNPGIVGQQSARLHLQQDGNPSGGWFGGWFSSGVVNEAKKKDREQDDIAALRRIRSAVPDVSRIVEHTKIFNDETFARFTKGLCRSSCTDTTTPAGGFAASYALHFTVEVAIVNLKRMDLIEDVLCAAIESQLKSVCLHYEQAVQQQNPQSSVKSPSHASSSSSAGVAAQTRAVATMEHWKCIGVRMVDAIMRLLGALSRSHKHHSTLRRLLAIFVELSHPALSAMVVQPLSVTLFMCIVDRTPVDGVFQTDAETWNDLLTVVSIVGVLAPYTEVRARMLSVLHTVCANGIYPVLDTTQRLAHAFVSVFLAPAVTTSEVPQDWMAVTSFDSTPYVAVQTPLRATKEVSLKEQEDRVPEALALIYKRLVALCRDGFPEQGPQGAKWHESWMFLLNGLVMCVVSGRHARVASDALLCLQRCVLDTDLLLALSLPSVLELFYQVIFPLTEKLCAVGSSSYHSGVLSSDATPSKNSTVTQMASSALSLLSPTVLMSTVFGPLAGPEASHHGNGIGAASGAAGSGTTVSLHVNEDIQCRTISLLPKTFLHYLYVLVAAGGSETSSSSHPSPLQQQHAAALRTSALEELWKRILGTMYGLYTSNREGGASHHRGGARDEYGMVKEAIQENVKNLVFVLIATVQVPEHKDLLAGHPNFWTLTATLIQPFDFGPSLTKHLVASKVLPEAAVSV